MAYGTGSGEDVYDVHSDHLDTPRLLTDENGIAAWRASYEAFGQAHVSTDPDGSVVTPPPPFDFNIRFPGQYYDAESGLHYNRFRYYAPDVGRYLSRDPLGQLVGGLNGYVYSDGRPVSLVDPLGLFPGEATLRYVGNAGDATYDFANAYTDQFASTWWYGADYSKGEYGWAGQDEYFHCRANCKAAQRGQGGVDAAQCISDAREAFDQGWPKYDSPEDSAADQAANQFGRDQGEANPSGDCRELCSKYRPRGSFPSGF